VFEVSYNIGNFARVLMSCVAGSLAVVFMAAGFVWSECKQLWEEGLKAYIRQWWNWLDFIMLSLYLCTFSLRLVAFFHSLDTDRYGPHTMPRSRWPEDDPTIVSEGVFAIANVFSFARIIFLFQANPQLGPLQVAHACFRCCCHIFTPSLIGERGVL